MLHHYPVLQSCHARQRLGYIGFGNVCIDAEIPSRDQRCSLIADVQLSPMGNKRKAKNPDSQGFENATCSALE